MGDTRAGHGNVVVRIDIRNLDRQRLFSTEVDLKAAPPMVRPPTDAARPDGDPGGTEIYLDWDRAVDDEGHLRRCPVCGCRELFVRKDFPQVTGFLVVVAAAVISMVLLGVGEVTAAVGVLAAVAVIDFVVFFFTGKTLVCYRCRSEFRDLPIRADHPGWDLAVGEKYRRLPTDTARRADPHPAPRETEKIVTP